jgi:hypothetical protein
MEPRPSNPVAARGPIPLGAARGALAHPGDVARDRRGDEDRVPVSRCRGVFDPHGQGCRRRGPEHLLDQRPRSGRDPLGSDTARGPAHRHAAHRRWHHRLDLGHVDLHHGRRIRQRQGRAGRAHRERAARSAMDQVFVEIFAIIALALVTYAVMTAKKRGVIHERRPSSTLRSHRFPHALRSLH